MDTGVDFDHPDLKKSIHSKNFDVAEGSNESIKGGGFDTGDDPHGTNSAGSAAAIANNGVGIVGAFGYKTKIMSVKVPPQLTKYGGLLIQGIFSNRCR